MQYTKTLTTKTGSELYLRNGDAPDGDAALAVFNKTHAETEYLLTYPDESSMTAEQEAAIAEYFRPYSLDEAKEVKRQEIAVARYAAEIAGVRIDKHAAYADWSALVKALPVPPDNPVGHFIEFCRKRARELR